MKKWRLILMILLATAALTTALFALAGARSTRVLLEWSTASEVNISGYNLYRGMSAEGAFERINPALVISTSKDAFSGSKYTTTDRAPSGKTYFYQLEAVENDGKTNRHRPITVYAEPGGQVEGAIALVLGLATLAVFFFMPSLHAPN